MQDEARARAVGIPEDHPAYAIIEQFTVSRERLKLIVDEFKGEIENGLSADGQTLGMIPSFVSAIPTGKETGTFLALDFGGTNFRVCSVTLKGERNFEVNQQKATIPSNLRVGSQGEKLFDFVADEVKKFVESNHIDHASAKLGFTFSFPVKATGLASGEMLAWSKNIDVPDVIGKDPVELLQAALERKGLNISVVALVNDTVGALMASAYSNPSTRLALIVGTGSNAAYVESVASIPKWLSYAPFAPKDSRNPEHMVVNMEWGNFDQPLKVLPATKYDKFLDEGTTNIGSWLFEKMIGGHFLGEVFRLVLVDLWENNVVGNGPASTVLKSAYQFKTEWLSKIEGDESPTAEAVSAILTGELNLSEPTAQDCCIIRALGHQIGLRAARLTGAAITAVYQISLSRGSLRAEDDFVAAGDGSVFQHFPKFQHNVMEAVRELAGDSADKIVLQAAPEGSTVGAAVVAAMAR